MWSMSLTVVVSERWKFSITRPDMSSGGRPVYPQITAMMGMRISGKMSTGVRRIANGPTIRIMMARTTNV